MVVLFCCTALNNFSVLGAEISDAEKLFRDGEYSDCIRLCKAETKDQFAREEWEILLAKSLMTLGNYPEAETVMTKSMSNHRWSLPVKLAAREAFLQNGNTDAAREVLEDIKVLGRARRSTADAETLIALGRAALLLGADPRLVLENFFNPAKKNDPENRDSFLAIGELALDKDEYDLAAKTFKEAINRFPSDADILFGLARAYAPTDRPEMMRRIEEALKHNKRHTPSLLLGVDHLIDAEEYEEAAKILKRLFEVNPAHPEGWAYRAIIAHLQNKPDQESAARVAGLKFWKTNPRVDSLIGQKLSQKYRFVEGAAAQRRALKFSSDYLPARIQLAQDLLRLGEEDEGWHLADAVQKQDAYDVLAYNLVTLHDTVSKFQLLTNADFILRMQPHEADVYGARAVELLQAAKEHLCHKYGFELKQPTIVEIFPEQKDFAIRTFGMPGGEGYLGVCFGRVITANSPASQSAHPSNWKAVLWHEFCHVVTLSLTRNKMPRWLSEGISVYEERQADPTWGQALTPKYRQMILEGELTPIGQLSGAFLTPKTPQHLQFAYFESSLVVEFLVQNFGLDALKRILSDLGEGRPINEAIEARTAPLPKIEKDFAAFARKRAEQVGPGLDWTKPKPEDLADGGTKWLAKHPTNYWGLADRAKRLIADKKWTEAKTLLQTLIDKYPDQSDSDNAYGFLAVAYRGLNETNSERQVLRRWAERDADAVEAFQRLMELESAAAEWNQVVTNAQRHLAVNPLIPLPHRFLAKASEELQRPKEAIEAYRTLLKLDPADLADVHFHLAKLLQPSHDPEAKRHVLQALEEAPRFRDAHKLLLNIIAETRTNAAPRPEAPVLRAPVPAEAPKQ